MRHRAQFVGALALVGSVFLSSCGRAGPVSDAAAAPAAADRSSPGAAVRLTAEPLSGDAVPPSMHGFPRAGGERVVRSAVGGQSRTWTVVVPPGTTDDARLPLLIVLHGAGGTGTGMRPLGFENLAAKAGVVVAFPDAVAGSWNDGRPGLDPLTDVPVDDVAFLRHLIRTSVTEDGVDPRRVAVVGHSNGALMAARAACDMSDVIDAAVLVAGAGPSDVAQRCLPSHPVALMVVFGTADPTVPYDGGAVAPWGGRRRGLVAPVREVLSLWQRANGCAATEQQELATKPMHVVRSLGTGCRAEVVHIKIQGGGHEWNCSPSFDTTSEAWRFVLAHATRDVDRAS